MLPVVLELENLRVTSLDVDFHELTWRARSSREDVLDYEFRVLRSEAEEGPYADLSGPLTDHYVFIDNVIQVQDRYRKYHYRVRVTRKASGAFKDFGPCSHDPEPDLIASELRRHLRLLFHEFGGRRCIVLPRRTFGQRCGCWHDVLQKRTRSGCRTCFDTSFVRGYLHPIESWIQVDPAMKSKQFAAGAVMQEVSTTMRLGFYPNLKPDDLIVEPENKRWRVERQTQTEHSRASVHQEVTVRAIQEKDIEFAVPVKFEDALPNLFFTPRRNFTNPHNLESTTAEDTELFGLYARGR